MKMSEEAKKKIADWHRGKKLSPETKAKIAEFHKGRVASPETRIKMSLARKGRKHKGWSEEAKAKLSAKLKEIFKDPEKRKKMGHNKGRTLSKEWRAHCARPGKQNGRYGISPPVASSRGKRVTYKGICFRSSYEARTAKAFDRIGLAWEYETERFDLGNESYLIDFKVNQSLYIEVKGWMNDDAKRKVSKFRSMYPFPLVVLTIDGIKKLEEGDLSPLSL